MNINDFITAKQANEFSIQNNEKVKNLRIIERAVLNAVNKGTFYCEVNFLLTEKEEAFLKKLHYTMYNDGKSTTINWENPI
jgi:hypothetical protein